MTAIATQTINLDLRPHFNRQNNCIVYCSQYDNDLRNVVVNIADAGTAVNVSTYTIYIEGTKPDKKGFSYELTDIGGTVSNNVVTFPLQLQMTACAGITNAELVFYSGDDRIGSSNFILAVEKAGLADDIDVSETDIPAYVDGAQQAAAAAAQSADDAEDAKDLAVAAKNTAVAVAASIPADYTTLSNDVDDLKSALQDDENVIGVHRSPVTTSDTLVAFAIPQNTQIKIYTVGGENLPSNRLRVYDSEGTYIDYFTINSTYGNYRIVNYTKRDVAYISLNSSYAGGIRVVWYENDSLAEDVTNLLSMSDDVANTIKIVENGYYPYTDWKNVTWSRQSGGAKPLVTTNANRASFPELLFVNAGAKIHIESYEGRKFAYGAWTLNNGYWTNKIWSSSWITASHDWEITEDCYIEISVANTDDTTPISISDVGVVVSIYDSEIYRQSKIIDTLNGSIPTRFISEMESTIESVRECLTEPCLVFPMVTDIHYAPNSNVFQNFDMSVQLMDYFRKRVGCNFAVNLGDNINGSSDQSLMLGYAYHMLEKYNSIDMPYLFCMGNHDTNYDPGQKFTIAQTYGAFFSLTKNVVYNTGTNGTDYYYDYDDLGIRVIVVNTQYLNAYFINDATIPWLSSALNTDKIVVLCTHMSSIPTQNPNGQTLHNGTDMTNAIQSFVSGGGKIIQLCGHSHADYAFDTPWLTIFSTCEKFEQSDVTSAAYQAITGYTGTLVSPARTLGDASEQAWNVVVVRPTARKVNVIRFGAGSDREFTF